MNQMQLGGYSIIFIVFVLLLLLMMSFMDMLKKRRLFSITMPVVKTELKCEACSLKILRDFKDGDYVFKKTDEKCSKCGGNLTITAIYDVSPREKI